MSNDYFHRTVLLISDHQTDIRNIEKQFLDTGSMDCRLVRCVSVDAAIEQIGRKTLEIDIIILDLRLEGAADPVECYKALKDKAGDIPVILLTGNSKEELEIATALVDAGAQGYTYREDFNSLIWLISSLLFPMSKEK